MIERTGTGVRKATNKYTKSGWTPGQSGNPNGRPAGVRNKRTQEIVDLLQSRGDKDPLDALSEIITKNQDPAIVAQASNILAPYLQPRWMAIHLKYPN
jgi:hypothetical protein